MSQGSDSDRLSDEQAARLLGLLDGPTLLEVVSVAQIGEPAAKK